VKWFLWGYSITFTGSVRLWGSADSIVLHNDLTIPWGTKPGTKIPQLLYAFYQGMFACFTSVLPHCFLFHRICCADPGVKQCGHSQRSRHSQRATPPLPRLHLHLVNICLRLCCSIIMESRRMVKLLERTNKWSLRFRRRDRCAHSLCNNIFGLFNLLQVETPNCWPTSSATSR
jgi:hypothetical protein